MSYVKFEVSVDTWVTRQGDPEDEWDSDSTDGTVTVESAKLVADDAYNTLQASFDVKAGDVIWLVWAQYSTGDSFGSYGGRYELCSVFDNEIDALIEKERLQGVDDYSMPWIGYFESLDFIRAEAFTVQP